MLSKCSAFGKKDDVAQIDRRIGFQKKLSYSLSVYKVLILPYKNPSYNLSRPWKK